VQAQPSVGLWSARGTKPCPTVPVAGALRRLPGALRVPRPAALPKPFRLPLCGGAHNLAAV
jgi:hypothetical protein